MGGDAGPLAGAFRSLRLAGWFKVYFSFLLDSLRVPSVPSASLAPCLKNLPVEAGVVTLQAAQGQTTTFLPKKPPRGSGSGVDEWWGRLRRPGSS